jgi:hypothetical protein
VGSEGDAPVAALESFPVDAFVSWPILSRNRGDGRRVRGRGVVERAPALPASVAAATAIATAAGQVAVIDSDRPFNLDWTIRVTTLLARLLGRCT